jgi:hypothetical protein
MMLDSKSQESEKYSSNFHVLNGFQPKCCAMLLEDSDLLMDWL